MSDIKELLEALQIASIEELKKKIQSGQATAAEFESARKFLADNGVVLDPRQFAQSKEPVNIEKLPFRVEERDQRAS